MEEIEICTSQEKTKQTKWKVLLVAKVIALPIGHQGLKLGKGIHNGVQGPLGNFLQLFKGLDKSNKVKLSGLLGFKRNKE